MSNPELSSAGREDFSQSPGHDDDELGLPSPAERLSQAFPAEFAAYGEHFVEFFPKSPYHVKTTYDPSSRFAGWPQRKSKRTKRPIALIDSGTWLHRTETVERHLDYTHWCDYQEYHETGQGRLGDFFWLGMNKPKMTKYHAIDADNKRCIGWYRLGSDDTGPILPVMTMPLEHFAFLKKLYDAFPGRLWCITSETLGLDIVERHSLQNTDIVHARVKRRLESIGHGDVEVHPMQGRCKRRPFGEHYRTITQDRVLESWQQQLAHYLAPGPTPSFPTIARVLLARLDEQWRLWMSCGDVKNPKINPADEVEQQLRQVEQVQRWIADDCPSLDGTTVAVTMPNGAVPPPSSWSTNISVGSFNNTNGHRPAFELQHLRGGNWPKALADIARVGLAADDSIGLVAFELAKWLWWVELFDMAEVEREAQIVRLLCQFVQNRHNNHISRWIDGRQQEVLDQITRCVKRAIVLDEPQSLELMADLRRRRAEGQYKKVIQLVPLLEPEGAEQANTALPHPSLLSIYISVGTLDDLDSPLPAELIAQIDKHRRRNKIHRYAMRLCNHLYQQHKVCRISWQDLSAVFLGYTDRDRTNTYNKILRHAGVLRQDNYVRGKRCCGYSLTEEARAMMDRTHNETTTIPPDSF